MHPSPPTLKNGEGSPLMSSSPYYERGFENGKSKKKSFPLTYKKL
jgi:hypothetical protein